MRSRIYSWLLWSRRNDRGRVVFTLHNTSPNPFRATAVVQRSGPGWRVTPSRQRELTREDYAGADLTEASGQVGPVLPVGIPKAGVRLAGIPWSRCRRRRSGRDGARWGVMGAPCDEQAGRAQRGKWGTMVQFFAGPTLLMIDDRAPFRCRPRSRRRCSGSSTSAT